MAIPGFSQSKSPCWLASASCLHFCRSWRPEHLGYRAECIWLWARSSQWGASCRKLDLLRSVVEPQDSCLGLFIEHWRAHLGHGRHTAKQIWASWMSQWFEVSWVAIGSSEKIVQVAQSLFHIDPWCTFVNPWSFNWLDYSTGWKQWLGIANTILSSMSTVIQRLFASLVIEWFGGIMLHANIWLSALLNTLHSPPCIWLVWWCNVIAILNTLHSPPCIWLVWWCNVIAILNTLHSPPCIWLVWWCKVEWSFLLGHLIFMFLLSWRGYWQELVSSDSLKH